MCWKHPSRLCQGPATKGRLWTNRKHSGHMVHLVLAGGWYILGSSSCLASVSKVTGYWEVLSSRECGTWAVLSRSGAATAPTQQTWCLAIHSPTSHRPCTVWPWGRTWVAMDRRAGRGGAWIILARGRQQISGRGEGCSAWMIPLTGWGLRFQHFPMKSVFHGLKLFVWPFPTFPSCQSFCPSQILSWEPSKVVVVWEGMSTSIPLVNTGSFNTFCKCRYILFIWLFNKDNVIHMVSSIILVNLCLSRLSCNRFFKVRPRAVVIL